MYDKIKKQPNVTSVYPDRLVITGDLTADEAEAIDKKFEDKLTESLHEVKAGPHEYATMHGFDGRWHGMTPHYSHAPVETGVREETLRLISEGLVRVPDDFTLHPKLAPQLQDAPSGSARPQAGGLGLRGAAGVRLAACWRRRRCG